MNRDKIDRVGSLYITWYEQPLKKLILVGALLVLAYGSAIKAVGSPYFPWISCLVVGLLLSLGMRWKGLFPS